MTLTQLLGIDLPIVQAPMAGVQGSALAIAVSNAGGLGSLPAAMLTPEALCAELTAIKQAVDRPFNVNFFCHTDPVPDAAQEAAWRALLAPYREELGLDIEDKTAVPSRAPFSDTVAGVLATFAPPVVSFHFGLPAPALLARVKRWGAKVLSTATTVDEARWLQANGADAVIAQGWEAGGHRGMFRTDDLTTQLGTFALVPQIVEAIDLPVIAAGGIADAQGVAAALALGASGVQVGTAFLLCPETKTTALHRQALASDRTAHTVITTLLSGRPARGMVNRLMNELGPLNPVAPAFPLAAVALAPLRAAAEQRGLDHFSSLWAGQNASGCRPVPAAQLLRELAGL